MNQFSVFFNGEEWVCTQRNALPHGVEVMKGTTCEIIGIIQEISVPEGAEAAEDECVAFESKVKEWLKTKV
jgi:hypothetical protein